MNENPTIRFLRKIPNKTWVGVLFLALGFALFPGRLSGHEFEDGFVERSVVFYAQDQHLIVEYSIGLNPNSMRDILASQSKGVKREKQDSSPRKPKSKGDPAKRTEKTKTIENQTDTGKTSIAQPKRDSDSSPIKNPKSDAIEQTVVKLSPEDEQTEREFAEFIDKKIKSALGIELDGKPLDLQIVSTEKSPRHHVNVTVTLKSKNLKAGPHKLRAVDNNFVELDGGVRYAMKCRGGSVLKFSNVAPSLVRAERTELGKIRMDARKKYTTVISQFITPE